MRIYLFLPLIFLSSCFISQKNCQEAYTSAKAEPAYDAIIVPGIPHNGVSWQRPMLMRVRWAEHLYEQGVTGNIIFSGSSVYSPYNEAQIMASYAREMGIPGADVYVEPNAEHSTENVYYSYRIAKSEGMQRIALATDPFQAKSLKKFIRKHDLPIDIIPIVFDTLSVLDHSEPSINPEDSRVSEFVSIKERESFFTRLGGTFGKHIRWYESDIKKESLKRKYRRKGRLIEEELVTN